MKITIEQHQVGCGVRIECENEADFEVAEGYFRKFHARIKDLPGYGIKASDVKPVKADKELTPAEKLEALASRRGSKDAL
jgi:hypothetical protein